MIDYAVINVDDADGALAARSGTLSPSGVDQTRQRMLTPPRERQMCPDTHRHPSHTDKKLQVRTSSSRSNSPRHHEPSHWR